MRTKTDLWVKAYIRQRQVAGAFAAVVHHGDDEAGAVLIKISQLNGQAALYGPAPIGFATGPRPDAERRFARLHAPDTLTEAEADQLAAQQRVYDSDLWLIEVEDRSGATGLEDWLATPANDR